MASATERKATLDDLYRFDGNAELVAGRIVPLTATGFLPNQIAGNLFVSLRLHVRATGRGAALADGIGFAVAELASGRESFLPDASYYDGPLPANRMRFIEGSPTFAVEVRSENDYGPAADRDIAAKRFDYFEAGTLIVWDVDPKLESVRSYRRETSGEPIAYGRGQQADAEPAVPGWRIAVDEIFA